MAKLKKTGSRGKLRLLAGILASLVCAVLFWMVIVAIYQPDHIDVDRTPLTAGSNAVISDTQELLSLASSCGDTLLYYPYGMGANLTSSQLDYVPWNGGFARRWTLTYAVNNSTIVTVQTYVPAAAVSLLNTRGFELLSGAYALGGVTFARMTDGISLMIYGQTKTALYSVTLPASADPAEVLQALQFVQPGK